MDKKIKDKKNILDKLQRFALPKGAEAIKGKWGVAYTVFAGVVALLTLVCLGIIVGYIVGPMEGYLHADYTDTIYWANASFESGKVFNPDFKYAALLPFSANLWFIPLIAMFGVSMKAQVIGMIVFLIVFAASTYFMLRSFGWSIPWTGTAVIITILLLSGSDKLREMMWGHVIYYSLALVLFCLGIGAVKRLSDMKLSLNVKSIAAVILTAVLFIGVAADGFQIIALVTLPCLGALIAEFICDRKNKLVSMEAIKVYSIGGGILVSTLIGMMLLNVWKGDLNADYTNLYSNLAPLGEWWDNLMEFPQKYLSLMGVDHNGSVPIFNVDTIMILVRMVSALACLVLPVVLLFNYKRIEEKGTRLLLWGHIIISAATMFGFVCGYLSGGASTNWRITTMAGSGVLTSVATLKFFIDRRKREDGIVGARIMALVCALLVMGSTVNALQISRMPKDYGRDNILHELTDVLEENDLEYGYATFWRSQAITLLSDSRVKTRMILADSSKGVWTDYYQNCYSWYEDVEGVDRYFVLLSDSEDYSTSLNDLWEEFKRENDHEVIELEGYVIYIFNRNIEVN